MPPLSQRGSATAFASALPITFRRPRQTLSAQSPHTFVPKLRPHLPLLQHPHISRARPFPSMSAAAHELRRRIGSVRSAEKIVSALRIVAAARIRASSEAALRTRPFAEELQHVLASLVREIVQRNIDTEAVAQATPPHTISNINSVMLADPAVQKALLDKIYLTLLYKPEDIAAEARRWGQGLPVTVLTVITADKGFCGPYNKDIIARTKRRVRELQLVGKTVELVVLGKTAKTHFVRHCPDLPIRFYAPIGRSTDAENLATTLSHVLLSEFIAGGVERIEVIYTRFMSLISSAPSARTLLPLTPTGLETVGDELFQLTLTTTNGRLTTRWTSAGNGVRTDGKGNGVVQSTNKKPFKSFYGVSDEEAILLLNAMLPMYVTSQLMRIVREAIASEMACRLAAMTAASDNARDIQDALRTRYNKERQARITNEIIEVVSNANA